MPAYITGSSAISPQATFDRKVLANGFQNLASNRWNAIEPDYSQWIDSRQIRRMSRVIRMSVTVVRQLLTQISVQPDAVLVGTSLGCLEDTHAFLEKLVTQNEELLSPTAFIHSTHNTIAAQVAMSTGSNTCYNTTYVHRAQSFESALMDAIMLIDENEAKHALVGGVDEIIDTSFDLMNAMGLYKSVSINSDNLLHEPSRGSVAGEGAAFFVISSEKTLNTKSVIKSVHSINNLQDPEMDEVVRSIFSNSRPDLILSGLSGDVNHDTVSQRILSAGELKGLPVMTFKDKCGEFGTSSSFALWMANEILSSGAIPDVWNIPDPPLKVSSVAIHQYQAPGHHSFILLEGC